MVKNLCSLSAAQTAIGLPASRWVRLLFIIQHSSSSYPHYSHYPHFVLHSHSFGLVKTRIGRSKPDPAPAVAPFSHASVTACPVSMFPAFCLHPGQRCATLGLKPISVVSTRSKSPGRSSRARNAARVWSVWFQYFRLYELHGCGSSTKRPPGLSSANTEEKKRIKPASPPRRWSHLLTLKAQIVSY